MENNFSSPPQIFIDLICKLINFICTSKGQPSQSPAQENAFLRLSTSDHQTVREKVISALTAPKAQKFEFGLEIIHNIEGCHPFLLEKWVFILMQNPRYMNISQTELEQKSSSILRSLISGSLLTPTSCYNKSSISISFKNSSDAFSSWDSNISPAEILRFPTIPIKLESKNHSLVIFSEYISKEIQPKIITQHPHHRPRLSSIFISGKDISPNSSISTDISPPRERFGKRNKTAGISLILSTSFEEDETGFRPLKNNFSGIFIGDEIEDEEFEDDSFEFREIEEAESTTSEDSHVFEYCKKCNKMRDSKLYGGDEDFLQETLKLVSYWRSARKTSL